MAKPNTLHAHRGVMPLIALVALVLLPSCHECEEIGSEPSSALFELPRPDAAPPSGFYALPFPNDIRVDEDTGAIDLGDYPRRNPLLAMYIDTIAERQRGFSVVAASHLRFTAPIQPDSLPKSPRASLRDDASVYMVNVDPDSPERGQRVPLSYGVKPFAVEPIGDNWLGVLPYPGFVLANETTYAVVVTNRLRAANCSAVTASDDLVAIMSRDDSLLDPAIVVDDAVVRAREIYAPLLAWLDEPGGDEREDVVSASVFTTQDATSLPKGLRRAIHEELIVPVPRNLAVAKFEKEEDEDEEPVQPEIPWFDGEYDSPNFQRGTPPHQDIEDGGDIELDAFTGLPIIQRMENLRFSFTLPKGVMPASGWPVVLYSHGTGGDYHTFVAAGIAERLAEQGLAMISIDQVMHPPRVDGSPELLFFNFLNPLAARDNTLQGAADLFQLTRLARSFNVVAPGNMRVRFDPERVYFFGHSQGGLTGPPFLVHEPDVDGAVLSGAGGLLYLSMILKTAPLDVAGLVAALIRDPELDEFNPVLAMLQTFIDRADPVAYGPYLARQTYPGVAPKHIFQSEGFTDRFTPLRSIEALATSIGVDLVEPAVEEFTGLELRGSSTLSAPVSGNLAGVTAVLTQYEQITGSDGHFVIFDVPAARKQSSEFLGSLARNGAATLVEP